MPHRANPMEQIDRPDISHFERQHLARKHERHAAGECAGIDCPYCEHDNYRAYWSLLVGGSKGTSDAIHHQESRRRLQGGREVHG